MPSAGRPGDDDEDDGIDRLFVYGTLRDGEAARALVSRHVARSAPATVRGDMYAFALGYPGVVDGDGAVTGELLWLSELATALALLDDYEGDDFVRVVRAVELADGTLVAAWCYLLADRPSIARATPVPGGDWVWFRTAVSASVT